MATVQGQVFHRTDEGGIGARIADAEIRFQRDGQVIETIMSAADGGYSIDLSPGRYVVTATHPEFADFSTAPGVMIVADEGQTVFNIFMETRETTATGPRISEFVPGSGHGGTKLEIRGSGFSPRRLENDVLVGQEPAHVVTAMPTKLVVFVAQEVDTGPVEVTVDGETGSGPHDFVVRPYPDGPGEVDGPPLLIEGSRRPSEWGDT